MLVYSLLTYLVLYIVFIVVLEVTIKFYLAAVLFLVYRHTVCFVALSVAGCCCNGAFLVYIGVLPSQLYGVGGCFCCYVESVL
jgi:hypothetical protein